MAIQITVLIYVGGVKSIAKILVTGATGFVGRHVLQALMDIDHDKLQVVAACRDPKRLPADYRGEVRVGDLRDPDYLDRLLVGIDILCHSAGWTSFLNHVEASSEYYLEPSIELFNRAVEWRVARFVNLSSIAVAPLNRRNDADAAGKPRRHNAMFNCLIGMEDYLRAQSTGCSVINLRAGIYSGRGLRRGLLPFLQQARLLPWVRGTYGYLPLVDGRDLAQAFVRAALAPHAAVFSSFNILGPEVPSQQQLQRFLRQHGHGYTPGPGLPALLSRPLFSLLGLGAGFSRQPLLTPALSTLLHNPMMDNNEAMQQLGYDPQISWQASLLEWLQDSKTAQQVSSLFQADSQPLEIH
jgi:nucleoside-diphosphate-sugar epimerase